MNILFVYTSAIVPENGGVQRVTDVLHKYFKSQGLESYFLTVKKDKNIMSGEHYFFPNSENIHDLKNKEFYINLLKERKIDIVINQAALGGTLSYFCSNGVDRTKTKIISVVHNSILANATHFTEVHNIKNNLLIRMLKTRFFKTVLLKLYIVKYKKKYNYMCKNSDLVVESGSSL